MSSLEQPHTVAPNLGLLRTHADNCADMQIHPLTRDPRGTVIGSLPKTSPSITDVGADASREHLRIWLEGEHWYAQGLGSTNGTVLESGAGDGDIVIEPPRDQREPGKVYPPVEIANSDQAPSGSLHDIPCHCGLARTAIGRRSPSVFRLLPSGVVTTMLAVIRGQCG